MGKEIYAIPYEPTNEIERQKYAEYLRHLIRVETFSERLYVDKVIFLLDELKKVDHPKDEATYMSFEEFCRIHNVKVYTSKRQKLISAIKAIFEKFLSKSKRSNENDRTKDTGL